MLKELNNILKSYNKFDLYEHSVILGYRGSLAHGTYIPEHIDDKDIMGVLKLPISYYFGLDQFGKKNTKEIMEGEYDIVFYEIRKFCNLLLKANPNVLSLLWLKPELYIKVSYQGKKLIKYRQKFLSKIVYKSFSGYAYGQLKKINHGAYLGYMGEKRKKLVNEFGFDCKMGSHLIRLLRMGIEILNTGELIVWRENDKNELLNIKNGKWTLNKVKTLANDLFNDMENARELTELPDEPDYKFINNLLIEILS